mgnify:CR=1 FL=1
MKKQTPPPFYGIPEVAAALGVHEKTVRRKIQAGELRAHRDAAADRPGAVGSGDATHRTSMARPAPDVSESLQNRRARPMVAGG